MPTLADALTLLEEIAPLDLAEDWDNVGLLAGDPTATLERVMTCLTLTPDVASEAVERRAGLVVTHHPLPFRPLTRVTTASFAGDSLWRLIGAGVAVYSAHTAYDSAAGGINQQWADGLGLAEVAPFDPPAIPRDDGAGVGRIGKLAPAGFDAFVAAVKRVASTDEVRVVPPGDRPLRKAAVACGSGGSLLQRAIEAGADLFVTGEMTFHDCLHARSAGVGLVMTGHYASERFGIESLAHLLDRRLAGAEVWASKSETDPLSAA